MFAFTPPTGSAHADPRCDSTAAASDHAARLHGAVEREQPLRRVEAHDNHDVLRLHALRQARRAEGVALVLELRPRHALPVAAGRLGRERLLVRLQADARGRPAADDAADEGTERLEGLAERRLVEVVWHRREEAEPAVVLRRSRRDLLDL